MDEAIKEFKLTPTEKCQTDHIKLMGGHAWSKTMFIKLIQQFGLETEVAKHLSESYGDRAWMVASMAEETGESTPIRAHGQGADHVCAGLNWPIHGKRLSPLYPYIEAEARYACRCEFALKATDFIARRTRISFLNVQATLDVLPRVIDLMAEELGWDKLRKENEFNEALEFLKSMGLPKVCPPGRKRCEVLTALADHVQSHSVRGPQGTWRHRFDRSWTCRGSEPVLARAVFARGGEAAHPAVREYGLCEPRVDPCGGQH